MIPCLLVVFTRQLEILATTLSSLHTVIENIAWLHRDTKFLFECWKVFHQWANDQVKYFSTQEEKFRISKQPFNVVFIIQRPMKHLTTSLKCFFAAKGTTYYVAVAMVIFSCVKISCFHAKAHLVFQLESAGLLSGTSQLQPLAGQTLRVFK